MLLPVLLLFFNVMLCVNEFAIKSDILCGEKEKFKCETVKTYITSVKKIYIYIKYYELWKKCRKTTKILVEAEQNHFKMLVMCIFIQTSIKGSFKVNNT